MRSTQVLEQEQATGGVVPSERRRHKRKPVLWAARIESRAGPFDCIILDLSAGGAKLRCAAPVTMQESVTLVIDRFGALRAEAIWTRMGHFGIRFTEAPEQIAHILGARLPV